MTATISTVIHREGGKHCPHREQDLASPIATEREGTDDTKVVTLRATVYSSILSAFYKGKYWTPILHVLADVEHSILWLESGRHSLQFIVTKLLM